MQYLNGCYGRLYLGTNCLLSAVDWELDMLQLLEYLEIDLKSPARFAKGCGRLSVLTSTMGILSVFSSTHGHSPGRACVQALLAGWAAKPECERL